MSFYVHITRAANWQESREHPISLWERLEYVKTDCDLRLATAQEVKEDKWLGETDVAWKEDDQVGAHKLGGWLNHHAGLIDVKNPSDGALRKMQEIALRLKANVIDEMGNRLLSTNKEGGEWEYSEETKTLNRASEKRPWWKRFLEV